MALTVSVVKQIRTGNLRGTIADVTFDSSYPTGGELLAPELLGLHSLDFFEVDANPGYTFKYDYTNKKILVYFPRGAISSTLAVSAHASGATPVTSDGATMAAHTLTGVAGVAAGAGQEVTNTTNLSTLSIRILAMGV